MRLLRVFYINNMALKWQESILIDTLDKFIPIAVYLINVLFVDMIYIFRFVILKVFHHLMMMFWYLILTI